ncbi:hypothetical protein J4H86_05855 [Spiractinospora alimapuensis]|uniref:hypothetical protein n=1 Tax=Spiractinospora alimapuensis TaxID=2820884 RepID=UPI001F3AA55D|nr:hypothetical protein [Spiractinospora alimapuensis]QVQ53293.1 hypothetical protein J4H86_05855 [Spiractinospora alimapuensis]
MEILKNVFLFLHLLGMAGIIAGWLMQLSASTKGPKAILHSSILQLVSGLLLVGMLEMGDGDVNHIKITVKAAVAVAVLVVAILNVRNPKTALANTAGALAVVNVAVAVFW